MLEHHYRTRTNFRGTCISRMPQMQHFHNFIFKPDYANGYKSRFSNFRGILFNGLLAELPIILDSFLTSTIRDYIGVVG